MKTSKILFAAALCGLLATSCGKYKEQVQRSSLDSSKAKVGSIDYDESKSTSANAAFVIDASSALAAGATSVTVYLAPNEDLGSTTITNSSKYQIADLTAVEDPTVVSVVFKGLPESSIWAPRVRANYPGFVHSDWTEFPGGQGICVGKGVIDIVFGAPAELTLVPSTKFITATWSSVPGATTYYMEYNVDGALGWQEVSDIKENTYKISDLKESTTYAVRVFAVKADGTKSDCIQKTAKTLDPVKFDPNMKTVEDVKAFFSSEAEGASSSDNFTLENDIDMTGVKLASIPSFKGNLDGKGFTLKNLQLEGSMFNVLEGTVTNMKVTGAITYTCEAGPANGLIIGGIAGKSTGKITKCTSDMTITVTASGVLPSPVIGGIAAFQNGGEFKENVNNGAVTVSHGGTSEVKGVDMGLGLDYSSFCVISGVVGILYDTEAKGCKNNGAVTVETSDNDKVGARHYIGGVVGTPWNANITDCDNTAAITADFGKGAGATAGKQVWIAGICGGRNGNAKDKDGANMSGCNNSGDITLTSIDAANYYLAGIAGQSQCEAASGLTGDTYAQRVMSNCKNSGKITKKGKGQVRCGSLSGGACGCDGCENTGEIIIEDTNASAAIGGFIGYPTQAHVVKNCIQKGNITCNAAVGCAVGGMFGQGGNTNQNHFNNTVNCTVTTNASNLAGMILGTAKTLASGKTIQYGVDGAMKVAGTFNGTVIDGGNLFTKLSGDGDATGGSLVSPAGGIEQFVCELAK